MGANVAAYPDSKITMITVGNEVYYSGDQNLMTNLAPAMQNLQTALAGAGLAGSVKLATVNAMTVLQTSDPPSGGRFDPAVTGLLTAQLQVLNATGSPFAINPYPYFAYQSDPRPDTLAFCLFQPNAGRVDSGNNIKYTNMFDAQVKFTNPTFLTLWFGVTYTLGLFLHVTFLTFVLLIKFLFYTSTNYIN